MKSLLLASAAVLMTSGTFAADFMQEEVDVVVESSYPGPALTGYVEAGVQGVLWTNGNEGSTGTNYGVYGAFGLWYGIDMFAFGVDGYADYLSGVGGDDDVPEGVRVLGGHAGINLDGFYAGVFGGVGQANDEDNLVYLPGYVVGIEAKGDVGNATLFGHFGYADIRVDGTDSGFTGAFGDFGIAMNLTDEFAVMVKGGVGYAPTNYVDIGDDNGLYGTAEIKGLYLLPTEFPLALSASYELAMYNAIDDDDVGLTHTVKVGISIPFGAETAKDALHVLETPVAPFRAAAWGDKLD